MMTGTAAGRPNACMHLQQQPESHLPQTDTPSQIFPSQQKRLQVIKCPRCNTRPSNMKVSTISVMSTLAMICGNIGNAFAAVHTGVSIRAHAKSKSSLARSNQPRLLQDQCSCDCTVFEAEEKSKGKKSGDDRRRSRRNLMHKDKDEDPCDCETLCKNQDSVTTEAAILGSLPPPPMVTNTTDEPEVIEELDAVVEEEEEEIVEEEVVEEEVHGIDECVCICGLDSWSADCNDFCEDVCSDPVDIEDIFDPSDLVAEATASPITPAPTPEPTMVPTMEPTAELTPSPTDECVTIGT